MPNHEFKELIKNANKSIRDAANQSIRSVNEPEDPPAVIAKYLPYRLIFSLCYMFQKEIVEADNLAKNHSFAVEQNNCTTFRDLNDDEIPAYGDHEYLLAMTEIFCFYQLEGVAEDCARLNLFFEELHHTYVSTASNKMLVMQYILRYLSKNASKMLDSYMQQVKGFIINSNSFEDTAGVGIMKSFLDVRQGVKATMAMAEHFKGQYRITGHPDDLSMPVFWKIIVERDGKQLDNQVIDNYLRNNCTSIDNSLEPIEDDNPYNTYVIPTHIFTDLSKIDEEYTELSSKQRPNVIPTLEFSVKSGLPVKNTPSQTNNPTSKGTSSSEKGSSTFIFWAIGIIGLLIAIGKFT